MEYAYEKLMKEHKLTFDELPADAQVGIKSIKEIAGAIVMKEKTGKKVRPAVYDKIRANDKWVVREILDYVEGKNTNKDPLPNTAAPVVAAVKADDPSAVVVPAGNKDDKDDKTLVVTPASAVTIVKDDKSSDDGNVVDVRGTKVDNELGAVLKAGKSSLTLGELKQHAPVAYDILFDAYKSGEDNGIETTHYRLIETEKEVFSLTKI